MEAAEVLRELVRRGCVIRVEGDRLLVGPADLLDDGLRAAIRANKAGLLALLRDAGSAGGVESGGRLTCPSCGAVLSAEDLQKYGDCPRCRKTLPGWEDGAPEPAPGRPVSLDFGVVKLTVTVGESSGPWERIPGRCPVCGGTRFWQPWRRNGKPLPPSEQLFYCARCRDETD